MAFLISGIIFINVSFALIVGDISAGLSFDHFVVVCGVLEVRVGVQCHVCLAVTVKSEFNGRQSLPVEAAYGREARIKPVARINRCCAVNVVRP